MKLHLPTGLRSALFACFAAVASLGATLATATVAGGVFAVTVAGSVAQAADYVAENTNRGSYITAKLSGDAGATAVALNSLTSEDTVTLNVTAGYLADANGDTYNANMVIESLVLNNGNSWRNNIPREFIFNGNISGSGAFTRAGSQDGQYYHFKGDVSGFTGTFAINNWHSTFAFTNEGDTVREINAQSISTIVYSSVAINGAYKVASTVSTDKLSVAGEGKEVSFSNAVSASNELAVSAGTASFGAKLTAGSVKLTAGSMAVNAAESTITTLATSAGTSLSVGKDGTLTINGDTTLDGVLVNSGSVTINGTVKLAQAITNNGSIVFGNAAKLDLSALALTETANGGSYTLFAEDSTSADVTGLTTDMLTGVQVAGRSWSINNDGTISYVVTSNDLSWAGGALTWTEGVAMTGGNFVQNDMVTFTGNADVTLGADISSAKVTVNPDVEVSLSGGDGGYKLSCDDVSVQGTLVLEGSVLTDGSSVSGTGQLELRGLAGGSDFSEMDGVVSGFAGDLVISEGNYKHIASTAAALNDLKSLTIKDSGVIWLHGAGFNGTTYIENSTTGRAVIVDGSTLAGTTHITGGATIVSQWAGTVSAAIDGEGDLTFLSQNQNMNITGAIANVGNVILGDAATDQSNEAPIVFSGTSVLGNSGDVIIKGGERFDLFGHIDCSGKLLVESATTVNLGSGKGSVARIRFTEVDLAAGAHLHLHQGSNDISQMNIALHEGSRLSLEDSNTESGVGVTSVSDPFSKGLIFGKLSVDGAATIAYTWKGVMNFAELTGSGNITFAETQAVSQDPRATILSSVRNYSGEISGAISLHDVYVGAVHQDADANAVINLATIKVKDFAKTGAGSLVMAGNVEVLGGLTMNFEGDLFSDVAKETAGMNITRVADGAVLTYTSASGLLALGADAVGESLLTLNLLDVADQLGKGDGVDLGISSSVAQSQLKVGGIKDGAFVEKDGNWWYKGGTIDTIWDMSWGSDEIAQGPTSLTAVSNLENAETILGASDSAYLKSDGGRSWTEIAVDGGGGADAIILGGAKSAVLTAESWIDVRGGTWKLVVGGNNADNWGSGAVSHFTGDTHIQMTGGTVDYILGGNYKDGLDAQLRGNTYISVFGGTLGGSIVGGSASVHAEGADVTGDSHIYVYVPLSTNSGVALHDVTPNAVIGGNLHSSNTLANDTTTIENTNIAIDLEQAATGDFVKRIIGGNCEDFYYSDWGGDVNVTSLVRGDTKIEITSPVAVKFTGDIIGGTSMAHMGRESTVMVGGDTNITLHGGTYGNGTDGFSIIGGMWVDDGHTRAGYNAGVAGTANITVDGSAVLSENANIIAASRLGDGTNAATFSQGGSNLKLLSSNIGGFVTGGFYISGTGENSFGSATLGDVLITVDGATVAGDIYGGSYNSRGSAEATVTQGNVVIDLLSGEVGNVYAAGNQAGTAVMTTASTTVNVASAVTLGTADNAVVVSGGYAGADTAATVTNGRTLSFTSDETYTGLTNATFTSFDSVSVADGGDVTAAVDVASGATLSKIGAGSLKLSNSLDGAVLAVDGGTLALSAANNTLGSLMMGGTTQMVDLSATQVTLNGNLLMAAGTLKLGADSLTLGQGGSWLLLDTEVVLDLGQLGSEYEATILSGVSDAETQLSQFEFTTDEDTGVTSAQVDGKFQVAGLEDMSGSYLKLTDDGKLVLTNKAMNPWIWDGTGSEWDDTHEGWKSESDSPNGQNVCFTDAGVEMSMVTIVGTVTPASVLVDVSADKGYTFTGEGSIGGASSLTKQGEGSLTISNANSYTGGTTMDGGTLTADNVSALGTGAVALNAGKLVLAADIDNEIAFGGGTLEYAVEATSSAAKLSVAGESVAKVNVLADKTATWDLAGENDLANGLVLGGTGTLLIDNSAAATLGAADKSIELADGATLKVSAEKDTITRLESGFAGAGQVVLEGEGTVFLAGDSSAYTGTVVFNGTGFGTSDGRTISIGKLEVADGTVNTMTQLATNTLDSELSGSGALAVRTGSTLVFKGNLTGFAGSISDASGGGIAVDINAAAGADGNIFGAGAELTSSSAGAANVNFRFNEGSGSRNLNALVTGNANVRQTAAGTLVLTADNNSTGLLTVDAGTVAIGSANAVGAWAGAVSVGANGTLHLVNQGTAKVSAVTSSGTVVMEQGNTLGALTGGKLTVNGDATVGSLTNVSALTTNALTTISTGDVALDSLAGTGGLETTAGNVTLGSAATLGGGLTVGGGKLVLTDSLSVGSLNKVTDITLGGTLPTKPGPAIAVAGAVDSTSLGFTVLDAVMLSNLGLDNNASYELLSAGSLASGLTAENLSIALGDEKGASVTVGKTVYSIGLSGTSITLTAKLSGNSWTSDDGVWDGTAPGWDGGVAPDGATDASFYGGGSSEVEVVGTQSASGVYVNAGGDATVTEYTFTGGEVQTGTLAVTNGTLNIDNTTTVKADATLATPWLGNTVVGSQATDAANDAHLVVSEDGTFTTDSLVLHVSSDESHGFTNKGTAEVTGALTAAGKTIVNDGSLGIGAGSDIGTVKGEGTLAAYDGTSKVGTIDGASAIAAYERGTLSVGSFAGNRANELLASGGGTIEYTGSDALTVGKLGSSGSTPGTFSAGNAAVTLEAASTAGLNITAGSLDLTAASGSVFGDVAVDAFTLDLSKATTGGNATPLVAGSFTTTAFELTLVGIEELLATGTENGSLIGQYLLMEQTGAASQRPLSVTLTNADELRQAFALAGNYDAGLLGDTDEVAALTASVVTIGGNVMLDVKTDKERVWNTSENFAGALQFGDNFSEIANIYDALTYVDRVNVDTDTTIDLTGENGTLDEGAHPQGLTIRNLEGDQSLELKGTADDLATLINSNDTMLAGDLTVDGMQVDVTADGDATLTVGDLAVKNGGSLTVLDGGELYTNDVTLDNGSLVVEDDGMILVSSLKGTSGTVSGAVSIDDQGGDYSGNYDNATISLTDGAEQKLAPKSGLTLAGDGGEGTLDLAQGDTMTAIKTTGANVTLANGGQTGAITTLTLEKNSSMKNGTLAFNVNMDQIAKNLGSEDAPVITDGKKLTLTGTDIVITQVDNAKTYAFDLSNGTKGITLATISAGASTMIGDISVTGTAFNRYFENLDVVNGKLVGDLVTDYYGSKLGVTENGHAGLALLDHASLTQNPQGTAPDSDMAKLLDALDSYMPNNKAAGDKLAAAVAGASVAAVGSAALGDVDRQLKAIRNRMTTMGVDQCVVNEDMPYVNAWINAEGDYREMSSDGTLAGYTLSTWGGTVGMDVDVNPALTFGLAATAMYGDFTAESADIAEGDLDSYYLSAFARVTHRAWVHSFVATVGKHDLTLSRTVNYGAGSYSTEGSTEGMSFGLLYEVGRTYALDEDATTCWQPVFNVAYRHVGIDGYTETGSDAAMRYGDQSLDMVTFGLGARLQTAFGENIYNRTSLFEMRALAKLDAGDRESEADVAFAGIGHGSTVKSAETGAFGLELGAGLTVPVGQESGSLFFDASLELRADYTNVNGTVGYRINF